MGINAKKNGGEIIKEPKLTDIEYYARKKLEKELLKIDPGTLSLNKSGLNFWDQRPRITYRPNDVIEIQPRQGEGGVEWWIRNKTLGEEFPNPVLPGKIILIPTQEVDDLYNYWRQNDHENAYHIESIRDDYLRDNGQYRKLYVFEEPDGKRSGWTYVSEQGEGHIFVSWFQTMNKEENRGVGGAMLEQLKAIYKSMSLIADSKHPTINYNQAQKRLTDFYKSHGLVHGEQWQKNEYFYISLDDKYEAGKWKKAGINVGTDNRTFSDTEIAQVYMANLATKPELRSKLTNEKTSELDEWLKIWEEIKKQEGVFAS